MKNYKTRRHSIRLQNYNYSQEGMYFITICAYQNTCHFGHIEDEVMHLRAIGKVIDECWYQIPAHFPNIAVNDFVIMPNHLHGILTITEKTDKINLLGTVIRSFKASVTHWARQNSPVEIIWQRNYYEHIVRNEGDYLRIAEYIDNNILKWQLDSLYPENL